MNRHAPRPVLSLVLTCSLLLVSLLFPNDLPAEASSSNQTEADVIVLLTQAAKGPETVRVREMGGRNMRVHHLVNAISARVPSASLPDLAGEPFVDSVVPDRKIRPVLMDVVPLLGVGSVWSSGFDGRGAKVAIIDSGIDHGHPALLPVIGEEYDFVEDDAYAQDEFGHGTYVAGIVASNDPIYRGVAPGATLLPLRVLNATGEGQESDVIASLEWAIAHGADVVNLSIGTYEPGDGSSPMSLAADAAVGRGVTVVASAGNLGPASQTIVSPADAPRVITVGAGDKGVRVAPFSSRGPTLGGVPKPDLIAPGWMVFSCYPGGFFYPGVGTSASAPQIAGIAALMEQAERPAPETTKEAFRETALDLGYDVNTQGAGRPQSSEALAYLATKRGRTLSAREETERLNELTETFMHGHPQLPSLLSLLESAMEREEFALDRIQAGNREAADGQLRSALQTIRAFEARLSTLPADAICSDRRAELVALSNLAQWHLARALSAL